MNWNDCIAAFEERKLVLLEVLKSADCKISLTADMDETMGYMCVACHFINTDWKLQRRIIKFVVVEPPHNGEEIFSAILRCIQDWNIEQKLFGVTIADSAANETMVHMLKQDLVVKKVLSVEGKLLHNQCAYIINLLVSDALKFVESICDKIRESVKYIQSSKSREQIFEKIVAQEGISYDEWLSLDTPTCWDSTYCLLNMAVTFKKAFDSLALQDTKYTHAPSFEEWEKLGVVYRLLEVCYDAITAISCSSCPTSNLYFHEIWKIKLTLDREASEVDNDVQKMIKGMKRKFKKYWKKSYLSLSIPMFYPRFKYMFVEFRFKQAFGAAAGKSLRRVQKVLRELYDEYSSQLNDCNVDCTEEMSTEDNRPFTDWCQHLSSNVEVLTELDRYLNERPIDLSEDFNILNWWMVYTPVYPTLARIARDVLAVPPCTVASESVFNTGERVISDSHCRLTTKTVESLICLRDWCQDSGKYCIYLIHGFFLTLISIFQH